MRTRITASFVAILAVALLIAGGVSLYLVRHAATEHAEQSVLSQARAVAGSARRSKIRVNSSLLSLIGKVGGLTHAGVLVVNAAGHLLSAPPPGVPTSNVHPDALAKGDAISASFGDIVYAAAPVLTSGGPHPETVAIVFEADVGVTPFWYFLLAAGISLVVAAGLATVISRVIQRRVVAVSSAARHIAGGDFSVRVATSPRDYPELLAMSSAINAMAEELDRGREAEREFLMSVSHDLRTPLTSIRGYSEAIAEQATSDVTAAAKVIVYEADRLARLIGDLLDLARLRARQFSLAKSSVDLADRVSASARALHYAFEQSGVSLQLKLVEPTPIVDADADRVGQVVANLLENALKFATSSVTVHLSVDDSKKARLSVADDGPGIHEDDLPHVFERLYSSRRLPARSIGTGLGLSIVAGLTEAMGGVVEVESPLCSSGGTAITVVFDTVPQDLAATTPKAVEADGTTPTTTA